MSERRRTTTRSRSATTARARPNTAAGTAPARPPLPVHQPGEAEAVPGEAGLRMAAGVEPQIQRRALDRLRRIEGQIRGVHRMVEEGRYCADILVQVSAVQEALRGVSKLLMRNHLQHCVTDALRSGDRLDAERAYQEVLDLMYTHAR